MKARKHFTRVQLASGFLLATVLSPAPLVFADDNWWIGGNGAWEDASKWSLGLPSSGHNVWLAGSGYGVNKQSSSPLLANVFVTGDKVSLNLYNSSLNAKNLLVGESQTSYLNQIDNSTAAISETLTLGQQSGSSGQYIFGQVYQDPNGIWQIVNGGTLTAANAIIGDAGHGHFHQLTGTTNIAQTLSIAQQSGSTGWAGLGYGYEDQTGTLQGVYGGTLTATEVIVGVGGDGKFHQGSGTTTITGALTLGKDIGSAGWVGLGDWYPNTNGVFQRINGGTLSAASLIIGDGGDGYYHQMNGTTNISNDLTIARQEEAKGTLHMESGTLTAGSITVGVDGEGNVLQTAGTVITGAMNISGGSEVHIWGGTMEVANHLINEGVLLLFDTSQLIVHGNEMIGMASQSASLSQSGSSMNTIDQDLLIGANGGAGVYTLNGGTFTVGGRAYIGLSGGEGTFVQNGGSSDVKGHLDIGTGGIGTYSLSGDSSQLHVADYMVLGYAGGAGTFSQTGGMTTVNGLIVGGQKNATGIYNLSGENSQLVSNDFMAVGLGGGEGEFMHTEGTTTANNGLIIGGDNGEGSYKLGGVKSTLIVNNFEGIGMNAGIGSFDQDGGTHTTASLAIGNGQNSHGTYNLSGESQLNVASFERIGVNGGTGVFSQSGGTNTIANELRIGLGGIGTYNLSGANSQLTVNSLQAIGSQSGTGVFNHTDGTNSVTNGLLYVGGSGNGTYNLSGNSSQLLASQNEFIGYTGSGVFNQNGGTHTVGGTLTISATPGTSSGTYNLSDGTLNVSGGITNNDTLNYSGGIFNAAITNNGNFNLSGPGTRVVQGDVINNGTIKTTETSIQYLGTFTNNGSYISDPSTQYFKNLIIGENGYLQGGAGDRWVISGDFTSNSSSNLWDTAQADLEFSGNGEHDFEFSGMQDWNSLTIDVGTVLNFMTDNATLKVNTISGLAFDANGLITNIAASGGLTIYCAPLALAEMGLTEQIYTLASGGSLEVKSGSPVPEPSTLCLFGIGLSCMVAARRKTNRL